MESLESKLLVEFRKEYRDVFNSSSISSNSEASSSSNILSMYVKELEQNQEESVQDIETGDILIIHQAIRGFLQPQDDDGDITTDNWESGQVNVRSRSLYMHVFKYIYVSICIHICLYIYIYGCMHVYSLPVSLYACIALNIYKYI